VKKIVIYEIMVQASSPVRPIYPMLLLSIFLPTILANNDPYPKNVKVANNVNV
jgi:hypothetical protein